MNEQTERILTALGKMFAGSLVIVMLLWLLGGWLTVVLLIIAVGIRYG